MIAMLFQDRKEAGRMLAGKLQELAGGDCVVLALPRGGVPVGAQVAQALKAPLDVFVVRKLGAPGSPELAIGAIAPGGARVLREDAVVRLGVTDEQLAAVERAEREELGRRESLYRGDRPPVDVRGKTAVLVDDGLATGATMTAAARAVRQGGAKRVVIAVPVGPAEVCAEVAREADEVVCGATPAPFLSVGSWYLHFDPTSDDEVRRLLEAAARRRGE